jgi:hypothetical protein
MTGRVDPFALLNDPPDFTTKPRKPTTVKDTALDDIARQNNFPSRQPREKKPVSDRTPRTYRTGRNRHFAVKATEATVERFYKMADERKVTLGALLELALDALERAGTA